MTSPRPARLVRSHLRGADQYFQRLQMDPAAAARCLRQAAADLRWAADRLVEGAANPLCGERDLLRLRADYAGKAADLCAVAERGAAEARAWSAPAEARAFRAAEAALSRAETSAEARRTLRDAVQSLVRWAEATARDLP